MTTTIPQVTDRSSAKAWLRALEKTAPISNNTSRIFPVVIEELAEKFGGRPALLSDGESFTYRELAERANRYTRWALDQGVVKGDTVCLIMPNRPEYMAIWLGITRAGGIVSLINTNLSGPSLAHCINIVRPGHIIVAGDLIDSFITAQPNIENAPVLWVHGAVHEKFRRIDPEIEGYSGDRLTESEHRPVMTHDPALHVYTSGTTGLPKAAYVSHFRVMQWSHWFAGMMNTQPADRMYNCLPMYHSVGGVLATGAVLVGGGSVVIRQQFSARQFWDDIVRWECTLFQYIGELCRYLLHAGPGHPIKHRIRMCCGNGLRRDVWTAFKNRFEIPQILEFYAATEGNFSLFNMDGEPGAIGRIPSFLAHRFNARLVKFNVETQELVRDERGFCIRCSTNEVGEAIGKVLTGPSNVGRFDGYTNKEASEKKILRDVFEPGDMWFLTGDLMRQDEKGYFYFVDRLGDTFRWKGENVSTSEVSETIGKFPGVQEANVYGVTIPGTDGRAGMAALVTDDSFNFTAFRAYLTDRLPQYARPVFVRLRTEIRVTTTFKHMKNELVLDGYDPSKTADIIHFNDPEQKAFVPLDTTLFERIQNGRIRL